MAHEDSRLQRLIRYTNTHKTKSVVSALLALFALFYILAFAIPKSVQFSYSGDTCAGQLTLFPDMHKVANEDVLLTSFKDKVKVGSFAVASLKTCFTPVSEPKAGDAVVATAPFGGVLFRKYFSVKIPEAPVASVAVFDKPLPISKPLEVKLSQPDSVFTYSLENGDREADCTRSDQGVSCAVPDLKLKQGAVYPLKLTRHFKGSNKATLLEKAVKTLKAVTIKKASIKNNQTVYAKPTVFVFTADKTLNAAEATLETIEKKPKNTPIETTVKGKVVTVKLSKQLAREVKYRLTLQKVESSDGSTLVEPQKIDFTMSGGPKVTGVNIGTSRVDSSSAITIQFDQKLSNDVDIKKYVSIKGGNATITKNASSVSVVLRSLPRCQSFSLAVGAGLPSQYDIKAKTGWSYSSRTLCHTLISYGTSVQGRPLQAYIFGNSGPVTMYVGAIHGDESSSSGLMQAWIDELEAHPERLAGKRIVVVPTINPDGLAANTRTNSRGVNLNRNFPTDNWQKDIDDTDGRHKEGGGKKPLSEPEAGALATLTQQYRPRLLLSFHAIGSLVQGDNGSPSASYAAKYASMVGYSNATGQSNTFDYAITGGYEEWAWRNNGIPSMVIELGSYTSYYIEHHRAALWAML